ncbi:MAG: phosphoglucosamine mutase, partial [Clostridia bacterium]|nr:phosphoglucosamine mutase [Clostridia bacterium]
AEAFTMAYLHRIADAALAVYPAAKIVLGRDTRQSGPFIENELAKRFSEKGATVVVAGMTATPALAYLTKLLGGDLGIMISASHNPPEYNGIKFFSSTAEKISDKAEKDIEFFIDNPKTLPESSRAASITYYDGDDDYIDFLIKSLKPDVKGLRICLDCANGATAHLAPALFTALGAAVTVYNKNTGGEDINEGCGATRPDFLLNKMNEGEFDIGFSYDGDGDRIMVAQSGKLFDGDHLMYVHARNMKRKGTLKRDTIVATVMSNMGTEVACKSRGITLVRTPVGDKYVHREMMKSGYNIGGEESGHIIFSDYMKTGDGILASLLTAMLAVETPLTELDDIVEYPKATMSYMCDKAAAQRFYDDEEIQNYLNGLDFEGRAVVRPSGTEPKIRILVEAADRELAEQKANEIKELLIRRLG